MCERASPMPRSALGRRPYEPLSHRLLRERRKHWQFFHVARVVLNDDGRLQICCEFLQPLDRSYGLGAIEVECRHAVRIVVLAEVDRIAGDDDRARLRELYQQAGMARRVPWRTQQDYRTVTEYILVEGLRLERLCRTADRFDPQGMQPHSGSFPEMADRSGRAQFFAMILESKSRGCPRPQALAPGKRWGRLSIGDGCEGLRTCCPGLGGGVRLHRDRPLQRATGWRGTTGRCPRTSRAAGAATDQPRSVNMTSDRHWIVSAVSFFCQLLVKAEGNNAS